MGFLTLCGSPASHPKRSFKKSSSLWIGAGLVLTLGKLRLLFLSDRKESAEDAAESGRRVMAEAR